MGSIGAAFRIFFRTLISRDVSQQVSALLDGQPLPKITTQEPSGQPPARPAAAQPPMPRRSEAVTLLASLQREARLVDLIQEDLSGYSDEQVGAAARNVLRDAAAALDRFFALQRVSSQTEGEKVNVPAGYDPGRYQLVGNVAGNPPYSGTLAHAGWEATTCSLPAWSGSKDAVLVIAPAEVEINNL